METGTLSIGELARLTGTKIETIRYYERVGIMPKPARSPSGYRRYGPEHVKRLGFVRRGRELGFGLDVLRGLLQLVDGDDYTCADVHEVAAARRAKHGTSLVLGVLARVAADAASGDARPAATTGVDGLEAIIPIAPNTSYYHYYRSNGLVRHPGGWLGEDIDFLFDFINSGDPARREYCIRTVRGAGYVYNPDCRTR